MQGLAPHDLLAQAFAQHIGEVLHHHRLQAKARLLPPLQQRAPSQRLQRFYHLRAQHPGMQDLRERLKLRPLAQHGQPGEQEVLQGFNPQQAGIANTNPYSMSSADAGRMVGYAAQQNPDILHQVLGPGGPLGSTGAKLAMVGIAVLAAKQILGGGGLNLSGMNL